PRHYRCQTTANETTLWLYDVIGADAWGGVSAAQFVQDLAAIETPVIHLRINSPGGDVFDARAIATALREHPARIIAHIDGIAASAASYVALHVEVDTSINAHRLIRVFEQLRRDHGLPQLLRTDNGPEFLGEAFIQWAKA